MRGVKDESIPSGELSEFAFRGGEFVLNILHEVKGQGNNECPRRKEAHKNNDDYGGDDNSLSGVHCTPLGFQDAFIVVKTPQQGNRAAPA
jgi:hypothetical protein